MQSIHILVIAGLSLSLAGAQSSNVVAGSAQPPLRPASSVHRPARVVDPTRTDRAGLAEPAPRVLAEHADGSAPAELGADALARVAEGIGFGQGDGVLTGVGPRYKVGFGARGPRITTPLGAQAERSLPLSFELESIELGSQRLASAGAVEPRLDGQTVAYARGGGITELYELRRDGIEQRFVLSSLPAVDGDLVVRGLVTTELTAPAAGSYAQGLEFRAAQGGVSIGGVTGIDANGRTVQGELRFDGAHLELVLPQAFVASAALPLIVDPLIGSSFTIDSGSDFSDPDVSYDETTDDYLVVYERQWSGTDVDVYAQRVSAAGALVGATLLLETSVTPIAINPAVGNINGSDRWFVCWQEASSIFGPWDLSGIAVTASTGALSSSMSVATNAASEIDPAVGGEKVPGFDNCIVVWEREGAGIRGAAIDVNPTGTPTVETSFTVTTDTSSHRPAISRSGGGPGRYLVVYSDFFSSPAPGDHDLFGGVVDYLGNVLDSDALLEGAVGPNEDDAAVDGDGTDFMVAFERQVLLDDGDHDIRCLRAHFDSGTSALSQSGATVIVEAGVNDDEVDPAIAFTGLKYHLAYLDERASFGYDLDMRELDPADCTSCGNLTTTLGSASAIPFAPAIASQWDGTDSPVATKDRVLITYESVDLSPPFLGSILGQRAESIGSGGSSVNVGGGCAGGGTAGTLNPLAPGSPNFTFTLAGASPGATLGFVNVNVGPALPFPCGTCSAPLPGILVSRPIVAGASSFVLPIPCDSAAIGSVWDYDWIVALVPTTPCPLFANVANSNVLRLTVGQ